MAWISKLPAQPPIGWLRRCRSPVRHRAALDRSRRQARRVRSRVDGPRTATAPRRYHRLPLRRARSRRRAARLRADRSRASPPGSLVDLHWTLEHPYLVRAGNARHARFVLARAAPGSGQRHTMPAFRLSGLAAFALAHGDSLRRLSHAKGGTRRADARSAVGCHSSLRTPRGARHGSLSYRGGTPAQDQTLQLDVFRRCHQPKRCCFDGLAVHRQPPRVEHFDELDIQRSLHRPRFG